MVGFGDMFAEGKGVPQDYAETRKWYRKAAEQGDRRTAFQIAMKFAFGKGGLQDDAEAVKWYSKAAEQGDTTAMTELGRLYGGGKGVPHDYVQAHKWYNLAAAISTTPEVRRDAANARDSLAKYYMTAAQIAEAQRLAREWKPK
jgi:TPR repeat protein